MVTTRARADAGNATEKPSAGEKHQTEKKAPEPKRAKTEKQTKIEKPSKSKEDGAEVKDEKKRTDTKEETRPTANGEHEHGTNGDAVRPSEEKDVPSNVLEKGIVHFFIRGRVGIDTPGEVEDVARSYMILRPINKDAKLGEGTVNDTKNTRLVAFPKKVLPQNGRDRFMAFVEKSRASYDDIKESFLPSADYDTKTAGNRHTPAATPVGEGVYVMTTTGRESHLAYMLTLPEMLGSAQKELGLRNRASFIISTKNPQYPGPAYARLPKGPEYSKEILDSFRALRWAPSKPAHLDFPNAQVLLIGESSGIDKAVEPQKKEQEKGKEEPVEVLEHLEDEDLNRMRHLPGDQSTSVFADLEADAKDYPNLQTKFEE